MRTIKQAVQFKRDLKREAKGKYRKALEEDLLYVISSLATDNPLESKYHDHALKDFKKILETAISNPIWFCYTKNRR